MLIILALMNSRDLVLALPKIDQMIGVIYLHVHLFISVHATPQCNLNFKITLTMQTM